MCPGIYGSSWVITFPSVISRQQQELKGHGPKMCPGIPPIPECCHCAMTGKTWILPVTTASKKLQVAWLSSCFPVSRKKYEDLLSQMLHNQDRCVLRACLLASTFHVQPPLPLAMSPNCRFKSYMSTRTCLLRSCSPLRAPHLVIFVLDLRLHPWGSR